MRVPSVTGKGASIAVFIGLPYLMQVYSKQHRLSFRLQFETK